MGYTVWAAAVLTNHWHLVVRTHRDDSLTILSKLAEGTFNELHQREMVPEGHPVWAERPYKVYLRTREQVQGRIDYVGEKSDEGGAGAAALGIREKVHTLSAAREGASDGGSRAVYVVACAFAGVARDGESDWRTAEAADGGESLLPWSGIEALPLHVVRRTGREFIYFGKELL
jgi:hypothetical protein